MEASRALTEVSLNPELQQMEENRAARRARITRPRWDPKKWHPVYEEVVLLDCLGYSRKQIAEEKGFTEQHITNITNTPQAAIIREVFRKRMAAKYEGTVEERLERLTAKAMKRIEDVIENDDLMAKNPLGLFDRAITVLKSTNKIKETPATQNTLQLVVTEDQLDRLQKGTELADKARALNAGKTEIVINAPTTP